MRLSGLERRRRIVEQVSRGEVAVADLVRGFDVSEMTIRRDLSALEQEGEILRTHGGAVSSNRLAYEFSFKQKEGLNPDAKQAIGMLAARLVRPLDVVFIDTGSTALAVARAMRKRGPRVIVTSNLGVALEFVGQKEIRVLVTGGELSQQAPDLYGEWALQTLSAVQVDISFFGCDAIDPAGSFYASDNRSAGVTRLMLGNSRSSYLVADHSKFGRRAMCQVARLTELTGLITDAGLTAEYRKILAKAKVNFLCEE